MTQRRETGQNRSDFLQFLMDAVKEFSEEKVRDIGKHNEDATKPLNGRVEGNNEFLKNEWKKKITLDEAVSQSVQFFIAGFDTVSSTIANAAYLLALHPDIQKRAYEEVRNALQKTEGELSFDALQEMNYLESILFETLRLYPLFSRLERYTDAEYTLGDSGVVIPNGSVVVVPVYALHRHPNLYPDPDTFDPDRFSPEERAKRDPYAYMAFGSGPRICIRMRFGLMQCKTVMAHIIANFEILRCPETKVPLEFRLGPGPLSSKSQILKFEERTEKILLKG